MAKIGLARAMRKAPSTSERLLWSLLRDRRFAGLKFRRQAPLGRYVVDFLCLRHRLIVEADAPSHHPLRDAERDDWLRKAGFRVLRIPERDVGERRDDVLTQILAALEVPPEPSPQGEKENDVGIGARGASLG